MGPGGQFLGERHTREHFRELWLPSVLSWKSRSTWAAAGATTLRERARAKVFEVWEEHVVEPLPEDVLQGMKAVIEARRAAPPAIEA